MALVKSLIRRGNIADMPMLDEGEMGLALDENRVFVGTRPIVGSLIQSESNATIAVLFFSTNTDGISSAIDLDTASIHSYKFYVTPSGGTERELHNSNDVVIDDDRITLTHGLGTAPDANDVFTLRLNKEITQHTSESDGDPVQHIAFSNSDNTIRDTSINFSSDTKNNVTLEYYWYTATASRKGTLDISVNTNLTPTATLTDTYNQTGTSDLVFSVSDDGYNMYSLQFITSDTATHQFSYTQTSFAKRPVV